MTNARPTRLTCASITKGLDCQPVLRGSIGPQRFSGAVSTPHRCCPSVPSIAPPTENRISLPLLQNRHSDMSHQIIERKPNGQFAKGVSGNLAGNAQRTRHMFNKEFLEALRAHFKRHGREVIERVARDQPAAYMKICALLVPKELKVEHSQNVSQLTDEQLDAAIEAIQEMLAARAGDDAKVIEGQSEAAPSLPAPVTHPKAS